jgi:DNA-3-methyladenine glycosylase I
MSEANTVGGPDPAGVMADTDSAALTESGLVRGDDGLLRCFWAGTTGDYRAYHDQEWGHRLTGDDALFERLCLEAFQSGLSWITILRRREGFRKAFAGFQIAKVAEFDLTDVERLMADTGIIRNRAKIDAAINNAKIALEQPEGLSDLLWSFAPEPRPRPRTRGEVPATTPVSTALAKELRRRGFRFVGPTTAYALMQATGMVDDHIAGCHVGVA